MLGPELQTNTRNSEQLILTQPELAHAAIMLTWARDKESMDMLAAPDSEPLRDKASLTTELERIKGFEDSTQNITWAIFYEGRLVGQVWIDRDKEPNIGHISTIIGDKSVRNRGIGLAAKARVLDWAFSDGEFECIKAWCIAENTVSEAGLQSLGFEYIGEDVNDEVVAGKFPIRHHYEMAAGKWNQKS